MDSSSKNIENEIFSSGSFIKKIRESSIDENKSRSTSIKKMIKNHLKGKNTNYRLLINHIIIIQNDLGVASSVNALRSIIINKDERKILDTIFYFLDYISDPIIIDADFMIILRGEILNGIR